MASTGSSVVLNVRLTTVMPAGSSSLRNVDSACKNHKGSCARAVALPGGGGGMHVGSFAPNLYTNAPILCMCSLLFT